MDEKPLFFNLEVKEGSFEPIHEISSKRMSIIFMSIKYAQNKHLLVLSIIEIYPMDCDLLVASTPTSRGEGKAATSHHTV